MTDAPLVGPVAAPDLHVMSFNIRRRFPALRPASPDRWASRRPLVQRILAAEQPTLLGVQEALPDQVRFVADSLGTHYRWVGRGRDRTGGGEHCAVYYDARRLELISWRQSALSDTPEVAGSRSWGNLVARVVVVAEFADLESGRRVLAANTHLDHLSRRSRVESSRAIAELAASAHAQDPSAVIVVTGDMNADAASAQLAPLTRGGALRDTWTDAAQRLTPAWRTFSNYRRPRAAGRRIDLVLAGPEVEIASAGINAVRFDGSAATDHEPVHAVLRPSRDPHDVDV